MSAPLLFERPKYLFILLLFVFTNSTGLFSGNLDSLKNVLAAAKEDTNKVRLLTTICQQYGDLDYTERLAYAKKALQLANVLQYKKGVLNSELILGAISNDRGKYKEALSHFTKALHIATQLSNNFLEMATIYGEFGNTYYCMNNYQLSLGNYLQGLKLYEQLGVKKGVGKMQYSIATLHLELKDYNKAEEYAIKANAIFKELKDDVLSSLLETLLGAINETQGKYDIALKYYKTALLYSDNFKDKSYSLNNMIGIANVLSETGKHLEAESYYKKSILIARNMEEAVSELACVINLGGNYIDQGKFDEAIKFLNEGVTISKQMGVLSETIRAYSFLSEVYEKKKDFKQALVYKSLYIQYKDSLLNEENSRQINELTTKYETQKKEKEIILLNAKVIADQKDKELLNLNVNEKNRIIFFLILSVLLSGAMGFLLFNRQKLKQQNKFQTEMHLQQKNAANALLQAQENERNRIAKELHDSIGTFLSTLKLNLQSFEKKIPEQNLSSFRNNTQLIDKTSQELRKITKDLSNEALKENGLANAIYELKENINASGATQINFLTTEGAEKFDSIIELNLYRIAQELLNNSIKHSKASHITLQLIDHGDFLLLMLEDNGIGFDTGSPKHNTSSGMGLKNIKERVNFLRGTLKIESALKKGSTFIIEVPKYSA
jgi:signal transduction histidine kinase